MITPTDVSELPPITKNWAFAVPVVSVEENVLWSVYTPRPLVTLVNCISGSTYELDVVIVTDDMDIWTLVEVGSILKFKKPSYRLK